MKQTNGKCQVNENDNDEMKTHSNVENQNTTMHKLNIPQLEPQSSLNISIESSSSNNNNQRKRTFNESESSEEFGDNRPLKRRRTIQNEQNQEEEKEGSNTSNVQKLYCICRQPFDGRDMLQCNYCAEFYHYECQELINDPNQPIDKNKFKCSVCIQIRLKSLHNDRL